MNLEVTTPFSWLKLIRRIHLFTGILLCPFVLIIGLSGFLFNHSDEGPEPQRFDPAAVRSASGFGGLAAAQAADSLVAALNSQGHALSLVHADEAFYSGPIVFTGDAGRLSLALDSGALVFTPKADLSPSAGPAPFASTGIVLPGCDLKRIQDQLPLAAGLPEGSFKPAPRGATELRFQIQDRDGKRWIASYDLSRRSLSARAADAPSPLSFSSFLTRLHKTHHYPESVSAKWCWILVADCTAIAMILWALSGLILACQIRALRIIILTCLGLALIAAVFILAGNFRELEAAAAKAQEPAAASQKQGN